MAETFRDSEERFRLAAQAGKMFAYEWNPTTEDFVVSGAVNEILGRGRGDARHSSSHIDHDSRRRPEKSYGRGLPS